MNSVEGRNPTNQSEDVKEATAKKKKKSKRLPQAVFENTLDKPASKAKDDAEAPKPLWDRLFLEKDKDPEAETDNSADSEQDSEENLTPEEEQRLLAQLIEADRLLPPADIEPQLQPRLEIALEDFYNAILSQKSAPQEAADSVLTRLNLEEELTDKENNPSWSPTKIVSLHSEPGSGLAIPEAPKNKQSLEKIEAKKDASQAISAGILTGFIKNRLAKKPKQNEVKVRQDLEKQLNRLETELDQAKQLVIRGAKREERPLKSELLTPPASKVETAPTSNRSKAVEARQLHHDNQAPEFIGRLALNTESAKPNASLGRPERPAKTTEQVSRAEAIRLKPKQVETLNRQELLNLSSKIVIDGSSLKQVYDTHLISEKGLRRLVIEHLKGGNVKKLLRREIVEREIDFERDPQLRDLPTSSNDSPAAVKNSLNNEILNKLIVKAEAALPADNPDNYARQPTAAQLPEAKPFQYRALDILIVSAILLLTAFIILLYLRRP